MKKVQAGMANMYCIVTINDEWECDGENGLNMTVQTYAGI